MLSAIFVDRPRLAIVIAIVTMIAGALALYTIPIAQYPDIVPLQVSVTTTYPGANSAVVDQTVAQPIEAQVIGVDKMIYMKSVSGDDGSYRLTCSFELGTNPDINTVNVNNRACLPHLLTFRPELTIKATVAFLRYPSSRGLAPAAAALIQIKAPDKSTSILVEVCF
jgi:hypothetical protein